MNKNLSLTKKCLVVIKLTLTFCHEELLLYTDLLRQVSSSKLLSSQCFLHCTLFQVSFIVGKLWDKCSILGLGSTEQLFTLPSNITKTNELIQDMLWYAQCNENSLMTHLKKTGVYNS